MKREVVEFVATYGIYQQVKVEHQKLAGKLQPLLILEWKWEDILMDFVSGLLKGMKGNDVIQVIVDRLTKFVLFLYIRTDSIDKLAKVYR